VADDLARLFVALPLAPPVEPPLGRLLARLREDRGDAVRWVAPATVHLTLVFLGDTPRARIPALEPALTAAGAAAPPLELTVGEPGGFPDAGRARVLWLGVEESAPLQRVHATLGAALRGAGFRVPDEPFRPHLTLGRARHAPVALDEPLRARLAPLRGLAWTAGALHLYESRPGPGGPSHTVLARVPFTGA